MNYPDEITANEIREVSIKYKNIIDISDGVIFHNSRDIYNVFRETMQTEQKECFRTLLLDEKCRLICMETVSIGSLNASIVHPREVFTNAVKLQAAAMIMMHNHPPGDPTPSRVDRDCTERMCQAGKILGICVLDHIVFGNEDYYSFADKGEL